MQRKRVNQYLLWQERKIDHYEENTKIYKNKLFLLIEQMKRTLTRNSTDCVCTSRQNLIAYTNCPGWPGHNQGAGIKDRMNILRYMFWFADELCAKVVLRCSPKLWLSEAHGCYASKEATWDNYFTPIRSMNGTLRQASNILILNPTPESLFENRTVIRSEEPTIQDYKSARRLVSHDESFVWVDRIMVSRLFLDKLENSSLFTGQQLLDDNCFRFSMEKVLIQFSKFHLERGHISCASCDYKGVHSALPII